jgi:peptidyl-prolyl cis-trans isomerase C
MNATAQAKPAKRVSVNGVVISRAAIAQETQHHPASNPFDAMREATAALVIRELLVQEAHRLGIKPVPEADPEGRLETEEEALVRALVAQEVKVPEADEAACLRFFEQNRARFRSQDLYEARHILLPAAPVDVAAREAAAELARSIIAELAEAPDRFAALAALHSVCPSGKVGGSLGQIGRGQTVPEFEAALAAMAVGSVGPEPVESRYGFHVIALDRRIEGRDLPYELVRARIADWLNEKVRRAAIGQYVSILAGRAVIVGVALNASASPLVR